MQIVPKDAPAPVPGQLTEYQKQAAKRESAIKAFMGNKSPADAPNQSQATPVANPTQVAPEELNAIKAPSAGTSDLTSAEFNKAVEAAKAADAAKENGQLQDNGTPASPEATKAAEPAKPDPMANQLAQLARKEKALRAKALEIKQREDALRAKEQPLQAQSPQIDPSKYISIEEFQKNPWKYMKDAKVTYDQVTAQALNEPSSEQQQLFGIIDELRNEIKSLKDDQTNVKKTFEDQQRNSYEQAKKQIKSEVEQLVSASEDFETVKATDSVNEVVELIEKTFHADGILLSVEEATKQVEDYLAEEAYKLSQLKKIQARLKPKEDPAKTAAPPASGTEKQEQNKQPQSTTKTLSNTMNGSRQLSARERAILAFNNQLNK